MHPDPFYKAYSSTEDGTVCHRGSGSAGTYGAETSDCDSPFALINETFKWIENNLRNKIDFVVWTGDSARHDNDEEIPRSGTQVFSLNEYVAGKFLEVFRSRKDETGAVSIPVVPTIGNNDILPHNILIAGPNKWLKNYAGLWKHFVPEEQRHTFERGGWFYVEVIPDKLAVFSLNTLYFFGHNAAVDGCAAKSEPGWEHMEWLRIRLQFMRERGMKAILTGHVPPARTESKQLWDETCWQKYTLWLRQYRDVVIGGIYGHMNIDHFMLQDSNDIDLRALTALGRTEPLARAYLDDELTISSAANYLEELRETWSKLPNPLSPVTNTTDDTIVNSQRKGNKNKGKGKKNKDGNSEGNGGHWGERFQVTYVGPSVVPNYFPTLRVIEYNVTGLEDTLMWRDLPSGRGGAPSLDGREDLEPNPEDTSRGYDRQGKRGKKRKTVDLTIPPPPSKSSPPGPAYSPQTLTLLGYTQYFANLTRINNDLSGQDIDNLNDLRSGKRKGKRPHNKDFTYEVEYSTFHDHKFNLKDMTVPSYLKLAHRIGQYETHGEGHSEDDNAATLDTVDIQERLSSQGKCFVNRWYRSVIFDRAIDIFGHYSGLFEEWFGGSRMIEADPDIETEKKRKKHKNKSGHRRDMNRAWMAFIKRAFVNTREIASFYSTPTMGNPQDQGLQGSTISDDG